MSQRLQPSLGSQLTKMGDRLLESTTSHGVFSGYGAPEQILGKLTWRLYCIKLIG